MSKIIIEVGLENGEYKQKAQEVLAAIQKLKDEQTVLRATGQQNSLQYAENAQKLQELGRELKTTMTLTKNYDDSIVGLRSQLSLMTASWARLSKEQRENTEEGKALAASIKQVSDKLKEQEKGIGDTRRNVGNYKEDLKNVIAEQIPFSSQIQSSATAFKAMRAGVLANTGALNLLKIALISTGIGAILVLLGSLIAYFKSSEEGSEKLERGIAGLKGAFIAFIAPLVKVGEFLTNLFTNPMQALRDFKALLSGNLLTAVRDFGKSVGEGFTTGMNVKGLEQQAEDAGRALNRQASKMRADAAMLRAKGDAESVAKAKALYDQSNKLTIQAVQAEIKAQEALIAQRKKNGQDRDADYDKLNELYAKIDQSNASTGAKAEKLNTRLNNLNQKRETERLQQAEKDKEANQVRLESEQKLINFMVDARQQEINNINFEINEKIDKYKGYSKVTEALEKERTARINQVRDQFRKEDLQKIADFNQKLLDETDKLIDLQVEGIKDGEERKIAQVLVRQGRELAEIDKQIDSTIAKMALGDLKQTAILEQQLKQRNEVIKQNAEERTQIELDAELKKSFALAQLQVDTAQTPEQELVARQEFLMAKNALEIEAAEGNAALIAEINARYATEQDALDEQVVKNKHNRFQEFSSAFQDLVGKNSLAGRIAAEAANKAAAFEQIMLSKSIILKQIDAIVSQGKLVFPLNVGAIFATLGALASGIAAAKSLVSIPKGFADGGEFFSDGRGSMVKGPGSGRSDSINARLSNGESVINAKSTQMFKPLLSMINTMGGGRPLTSPAPFGMADGGMLSSRVTGDLLSKNDMINGILAGMSAMPQPIVSVQEIHSEVANYVQAKDVRNI